MGKECNGYSSLEKRFFEKPQQRAKEIGTYGS